MMVAENRRLPYIGFIVTLYPGDLIFDFSNRMPRRRFRGIPTARTLTARFFRRETYVAREKCFYSYRQTATTSVCMYVCMYVDYLF